MKNYEFTEPQNAVIRGLTSPMGLVGWIIVRGATNINATGDLEDSTTVLGDAFIMGSLWTGELNIKVGGSATVNYCHQCMQLVDGMDAVNGTVPRPMRVVSWGEVL